MKEKKEEEGKKGRRRKGSLQRFSHLSTVTRRQVKWQYGFPGITLRKWYLVFWWERKKSVLCMCFTTDADQTLNYTSENKAQPYWKHLSSKHTKRNKWVTAEIAHWFRARIAPAEDPCSFPAPTWRLRTFHSSSARESDTLLCPLRTPCTHGVCMHTCRQNLCTYKVKYM